MAIEVTLVVAAGFLSEHFGGGGDLQNDTLIFDECRFNGGRDTQTLPCAKEFVWTFLHSSVAGMQAKILGTSARDISRVIACTRATWWNFHYLILYNCDVLVPIQIERDQSSAYLLTNGTSRGLHLLVIGARQRLDIAMRKVDPWPRTNKSPTHMRTKGNLQLFLENHRVEVDHINCF